MANPVWTTPAGTLGIVPENNFFQLTLNAIDPAGGNVSYKFLAGTMPPGMYVVKTGSLQGVPIVTDTTSNANRSYTFTIRASDVTNLVTDRTFNLTVSNIIPPTIEPSATSLGEVFDGQNYSLQLTAIEVNPEATLTWSLISGSLPNGVSLSSSGLLSGYINPLPVLGNAGTQNYGIVPYNEFGYDNQAQYQNNNYKFTVQVYDGANYSSKTYTLKIIAKDHWQSDTTLDTIDSSLTVDEDNRYLPALTTPSQYLPEGRSNSKYAFQFQGIDPNGEVLQYALYGGSLSGFDGGGTDNQILTIYLNLSTNITANAGNVISQTALTNGISSTITANVQTTSTGNVLTISGNTLNTPFNPTITFANTSAYLFKDGANTGATITSFTYNWTLINSGTSGTGFSSTGFDQTNLSLPSGLSLDTNTGWLSGTLGAQSDATKTYTFKIYTYERDYTSYASTPQIYYLTVLGDITNTVAWTTSANLGIIDNGSISELSVSAVSNANKPLTYSLVTDQSHLPQGLQLLPSGHISGRCTFEYFSLDGGATTIDGANTTFDNTYTFTVKAQTTDNTASSTQAFTIIINNFNKIPYENLYLKALPTLAQRQTFLSIVNNTEIFPPSLIYRSDDPWFGRATDIRSLFLAGLNPAQMSTFTSAMANNTYNKRIEFSDIKTAQALDANFNVRYEVVYVELVDNAVYKGNSPSNTEYDKFISANVYPNAFNNMASTISSTIGYANQGALPDWMTSPQANKKQLGFTRAIVLAYTVPGASALIAYRLKSNGIVFNSVDFVADRYDLDDSLLSNYSIIANTFVSGSEATFDRIKRPGKVAFTADYGVRNLAFDMINNQTVAQIQAAGGIDGINHFNDGQTLIFLRQENFPGETSANDGWNLVTNSGTTVVPGYLTNLLNPAIPNERAGIWRINVSTSNLVTLTFVQAVVPGQYVQINYGISQNNSIVYYNQGLQSGQSVLSYVTIPTLLAGSGANTRFDNYGTRFINNRDKYQNPESGDTYLKFPKMGEVQ